jgi:CMP-N,N'-diacetyllegionaminic acid synthase
MKTLAIIPARAGSKGVPGKNVRLVHGKPLVAWTIECALAARGLDRLVVSSDDDAVLSVARGYSGLEARRRPAELAEDQTPIVSVVAHSLAEEERAGGGPFDVLALLQPTAPLREPLHVEQALAALREGVNAVISVTAAADLHPARTYDMAEDGVLSARDPAKEQARRQDLPPVYHRNGSLYVVRRAAFERQHALMARPAVGYVMDERYRLNIDEPRDLLVAEALVAAWRQGRL